VDDWYAGAYAAVWMTVWYAGAYAPVWMTVWYAGAVTALMAKVFRHVTPCLLVITCVP